MISLLPFRERSTVLRPTGNGRYPTTAHAAPSRPPGHLRSASGAEPSVQPTTTRDVSALEMTNMTLLPISEPLVEAP